MQYLQSLSARPELAPVLSGAPLEIDAASVPQAAPVREIERPPVEAEATVEAGFIEVLQANLRAAAQHSALGHEGKNFRQCSRPACRDAAMIIPHLEHVTLGATDAELEVVFSRVLAALETAPPKPAAARTTLQVAP